MPEQIPLTLTRHELDQLLEALSERAESWERIAEVLQSRSEERVSPPSKGRSQRSTRNFQHPTLKVSEADRIVAQYHAIMDKILEQAEGDAAPFSHPKTEVDR